MKKITLFILSTIITLGVRAQAVPELLVTMPTPPDNIERLDERCTYIVDRYWDTFNPKSSFSSLDRLDRTMEQFFSIAPYANAQAVHTAIDRLIEKVGKAKADNLVVLARYAEKWTQSDSAEYVSDEVYFPFVRAVATNKKVKSPEKARYALQYKQLSNSQKGMKPADFAFTRPDGTVGHLSEANTPYTLLFFYDPECTDCRLAKARLAADMVIPALIRNGSLTLMAIYPGDTTDEWRKDALTLPKEWTVGAYPEADSNFTMHLQPQYYFLDKDHTILVKDIPTDNILKAFSQFIVAPASAVKSAEPAAEPAATPDAQPQAN